MIDTKYDNPEALLLLLKKKKRTILRNFMIVAIAVSLIVCIVHTIMGWIFVSAVFITILLIFGAFLLSSIYTIMRVNYYKLRIINKLTPQFDLGIIYHDKIEDRIEIGKILSFIEKSKLEITDRLEWEIENNKVYMENIFMERKFGVANDFQKIFCKVPCKIKQHIVVKKNNLKGLKIYSSKLKNIEENFLPEFDLYSEENIDDIKIKIKKYLNNKNLSLAFYEESLYMISNDSTVFFDVLADKTIKMIKEEINTFIKYINEAYQIFNA